MLLLQVDISKEKFIKGKCDPLTIPKVGHHIHKVGHQGLKASNNGLIWPSWGLFQYKDAILQYLGNSIAG